MSRVLRDAHAPSTVHVVVADAATAAATSTEFADGGGSAGGGAAVCSCCRCCHFGCRCLNSFIRCRVGGIGNLNHRRVLLGALGANWRLPRVGISAAARASSVSRCNGTSCRM